MVPFFFSPSSSMALSVAYASNINLFAYNQFHRVRWHDVTETTRRNSPPWVSPAIVLKRRKFPIFSRAAAGEGGPAEFNPGSSATSKDIEVSNNNGNSGEGYIGLFVQMLGLDNNPVDREHAVVTLWKYSEGGKNFIDVIMKFPGCVNLVLSLLKSDNPSTCEAAAGLLRNISSVKLYRDIIAESGVIEEISWLLHQSFLSLGVKEQSLCTLWNLSIDEKPRIKIARGDLLPLLIKLLDDEEIKVKEAAAGVLSNLTLSPCNHCNMVEVGVIPKLATDWAQNECVICIGRLLNTGSNNPMLIDILFGLSHECEQVEITGFPPICGEDSCSLVLKTTQSAGHTRPPVGTWTRSRAHARMTCLHPDDWICDRTELASPLPHLSSLSCDLENFREATTEISCRKSTQERNPLVLRIVGVGDERKSLFGLFAWCVPDTARERERERRGHRFFSYFAWGWPRYVDVANLFKSDAEGLKVIRKSAKTALLELSKDDYYRVLIFEEGLIKVPLIGAAAYKSFRPQSHSWPSLPDGTELERTSRSSRYGATELLLGLSVREKDISLEEAKINAIVGRSQQLFLARIGAIENDGRRSESDSSLNQQYTLLPWIDGVAWLVLFLDLEEVSAITRAAYSIADGSISEHLRISFKEAGAVKRLVQLLSHDDKAVQEAVVYALDRLSLSYEVLQTIEAEGIVHPLVDIIKRANASGKILEKILNILHRVIDPGKYMERKLHDKVVSGSDKRAISSYNSLNSDVITRASETSSMSDLISRERVIDSDVVKYLIRILKTSSPTLQTKIASIFEHLSSFEPYVTMLTISDIESGLHAVFQNLLSNGTQENVDNQLELNTLMAEEIGLAVAAASRLLTKLLNFEQFHHTVKTSHFQSVLRDVLRSNIPLHTKDWVAACLVKLESKASSGWDMGDPPIGLEVIVYDTIPRLVEQMSMSFSLESREAAAIELNEVISEGGVECSRAVTSAGGIFSLVKLIEEASGNGLEACLSILYNLSMDDENHPAMVSAGIIPVLKRIVLAEGAQWPRALRLLRTLPT
ncbi:hypothetical protein IEQ34_006922 [Dendrobium chrysotoxum]|uniref:Uncharacterized protein n=1 Tax=Dendrobium chrysotoxum TaxID=161865 RepID=A0AAV7H6G3_DENCH|nr:hypothetical protein IEQ34_006922 [Dendrobium chrysotoxum]